LTKDGEVGKKSRCITQREESKMSFLKKNVNRKVLKGGGSNEGEGGGEKLQKRKTVTSFEFRGRKGKTSFCCVYLSKGEGGGED